MSKLLRLFLILAFCQLWSLQGVAQRFDPGKGDTFQPPGIYRWTITNDCQETIRLAIRYAPGRSLITQGWWILRPLEKRIFVSNTPHVAWYAKSQSYTWNGKGRTRELIGVDLAKNFKFEGFDSPGHFNSVPFNTMRAQANELTSIKCAWH